MGLKTGLKTFNFFAKNNGERTELISEILNRCSSNHLQPETSSVTVPGEEAKTKSHKVIEPGEWSIASAETVETLETRSILKSETATKMVGDHDDEAQCELHSERERLKKEAQRLERLQKELDRERAQMAAEYEGDHHLNLMKEEYQKWKVKAKAMEGKCRKLKAELKWERTKLQREKGEKNKMESVRRNSIELDAKRRRDQLEAEREEHRKHSRVQREKLKVKEAELKSICAVLERQKKDINAERKEMERNRRELQRERDQFESEREQFEMVHVVKAKRERLRVQRLRDEMRAQGERMRVHADKLEKEQKVLILDKLAIARKEEELAAKRESMKRDCQKATVEQVSIPDEEQSKQSTLVSELGALWTMFNDSKDSGIHGGSARVRKKASAQLKQNSKQI